MAGEMVLYQSEDGKTRLETRLENDTLWLTRQQIAELFQTTVPNISMHIKNVFDEGELQFAVTVQDFLTVRQEGERQVQRSITHYNLNMVISVGYRVKSLIATRFRIWATQQLKEYIVKGFVMDDERLKNPPVAGSTRLIILPKCWNGCAISALANAACICGYANFLLWLYLLRNADTKAKGLGFALAGNFYPDFLLRLVDDATGQQWLSFVDHKGLRHMNLNDPKLSLYKEVKALQEKLANEKLNLNAFIVSPTPFNNLLNVTCEQADLEACNVLFMSDAQKYLQKMFEKNSD
jgi:hypothetical protein